MTRPATAESKGASSSVETESVTGVEIVGVSLLLLALPAVVYYLWFCLAYNHGQLAFPSSEMAARFPWPTATSATIAIGWLLFQGVLQLYAPGRWVDGQPLHDGSRLPYKMNGWFSWWATWALLAAGVALHLFEPTVLADQLGPLLTTANLLAFAISLYVYALGRRSPRSERVTRNPLYDFWSGTSLNPRLGRLDLKLFFESRPGLMGWVALDLSLAAKQYQVHGFVSAPMVVVCLFHFWYVADYYFHEEAILSTWDVKHENFGFMLCWGDLVWVPFTYTIQAHYLLSHPEPLPWYALAALLALNFVGYAIFRGANAQKHEFRKDPAKPIWGKPPSSIPTARGTLLLASGWWGMARHMNYLGDLLMGLAWCLVCGFGSPIPYFYITYFAILLIHRERRDYAMCAQRYGDAWAEYCKRVPHRIIPWVY